MKAELQDGENKQPLLSLAILILPCRERQWAGVLK